MCCGGGFSGPPEAKSFFQLMQKAEQLIAWQSDTNIKQLYGQFKDNPKIKWKESIKKVLGLKIPIEAGLDV